VQDASPHRPEERVRLGRVKARTASAGTARNDKGGCVATIRMFETSMAFLDDACRWPLWLHRGWTSQASACLHALRQGGLPQSGSHTSSLRRARGRQGTAGPRAAPRAVRPAALALSAAGAVGTWNPVCTLLWRPDILCAQHVCNRSTHLVQYQVGPVPGPVLPRGWLLIREPPLSGCQAKPGSRCPALHTYTWSCGHRKRLCRTKPGRPDCRLHAAKSRVG
jgi:hypothetical protein